MFDIITIGSATRDVFLTSNAMHPHFSKDAASNLEACFPFGSKINIDNIHFDTGGGATNTAVTFARLGKLNTAALTRVGADSSGYEIIEVLKKENVDTSLIQIAPKKFTAYSVILSPGGGVGERTILVYRGAARKFDLQKINWPKLKAKWFYISSLAEDFSLLKKLLNHAAKNKIQIMFNPGGQELKDANKLKPLLKKINFFVLNREETAKLTGIHFLKTDELLRALRSAAPASIMTDGASGAYFVDQKETFYMPSAGHKPKNITGAGDAFGSGFIVGWIKSKGNIIEALQVGSINADSVVQHVGAKVGILVHYPSRAQLNKLSVRKLSL